MRSFDNWQSYLNNDGNLLHGKIRFCRQGTTDNVVIYNSDGNPIRNPEFTDMLGRTEYQVFVDSDANVTAYYYQYIGTGDMMQWPDEDYDPSRWAYQYSSDNLDPVSVLDVTSDAVPGVATMSDLRAVDPATVPTVGGVKMIWLYGYYTAGDKSPVVYVWDATDRSNDDGGAVIQCNAVPGVGRWHLATRELHFDVRHFGIFATNDKYSTDYSYTSQLSNCANYVNNEGCDAWFPDIYNQAAYYLFDGTNTFSIGGDIYCGNTVYFVCKTGTSGTAISCHELHKKTTGLFDSSVQTGTATITADYIKMSWVGGQCTGNARLGWIIDSSSYTRVLTNQHVRFDTNGHYGLQLINCTVESDHKITGPIVMEGMELKSEWFADDYSWSNLSVGPGCSVHLRNCKNADEYILLKNKLGQVDYGDLGEQTVTNAVFGNNAIVENFAGTATLQGSAEIHNASATFTLTGVTPVLNLVDCWVTLNPASASPLGGLRMQRGELYGTGLSVLNSVNLTDVAIYCTISALGSVFICNNCVINAAISHVGDPVQEQFRNCIFNDSLSISGGGTNATVQAIWTGNVGNCQTPIIIDRTNIDPDDTHHTYTYSGNSGTFMPDSVRVSIDPQVEDTHSSSYIAPTAGKILFYIQDNKDIGMAYSAAVVPSITLFHVGADIDCVVQTWWKVGYQTFTGGTELYNHYSFYDEMSESQGNSSSWSTGYRQLPITGRLDTNDPTVTSCHVTIEVSRA